MWSPGQTLLRLAGAMLLLATVSSCQRDQPRPGVLLERTDFVPAGDSFERKLSRAFVSTGSLDADQIDLGIEAGAVWSQVITALDAIVLKGPVITHVHWNQGSTEVQFALVDGNRLHWQYEFPVDANSDTSRGGDILIFFTIDHGSVQRNDVPVDLKSINQILIDARQPGTRIAVTFHIPHPNQESAELILQHMEFVRKRGCRVRLGD